MKRLVGACLVCLVSAGCGGGGASNVSNFCASYNTAIEKIIVKCLGAPQDAIDLTYKASDQQSCTDAANAVATKRATYDAKKGQACLDELAKLACTDVGTFGGASDPCITAITGTVATGGSCYQDLDCTSADYCNGVSGQNCPASCAPYAQKGADCSQGQACDYGLACDGQVCQPLAQKGDTCGGVAGTFCDQGLYCDGVNGAAGVCQTQKAPGASCTAATECEVGFGCMSGKCTAVHTVGGTCSQDTDCGYFTHCVSGTCTEDPKAGGACGMQTQQSFITCLDSWCKITNQTAYTGTCKAYLKPGDACSGSDFGSCGNGECGSSGQCIAACAEAGP